MIHFHIMSFGRRGGFPPHRSRLHGKVLRQSCQYNAVCCTSPVGLSNSKQPCSHKRSQTSVHERLVSWTIRFTNKFFRTQSVSDDVLCLELRTREPSTSWGKKGQKKRKRIPLPNNNISLPHHLPLTPSTLLHTGTVKLNSVFVYIWSA